MHDDDDMAFSARRRKALLTLGGAGTALLGGRSIAQSNANRSGAPACVLTPAQTEGPYFVDERLDRSDIRSDPSNGSARPGARFTLELRVSAVAGARCTPVDGATVDIWHCDAAGIYSDTDDMRSSTPGAKFLRGYQVTDAAGTVRFTTIYPGWYDGRTVHIHFKVRGAAAAKRNFEFTSQLYFDDALTDRVYARDPYARRARRTVRNGGDGIFRAGGSRLILPVVENDAGYAGNFNVGLKLA